MIDERTRSTIGAPYGHSSLSARDIMTCKAILRQIPPVCALIFHETTTGIHKRRIRSLRPVEEYAT